MSAWSQTCKLAVLVAAVNSIALVGVMAQPAQPGSNSALQGFSQNSDKPVQIKAQTFEVRDKENLAIFSGNVHVVQGDTTVRCKSLIVSYLTDTKSADGARAAQPGPGGKSQISKLEAKGSVIVTQKDQTATGDSAVYDMRLATVTLTGNVVVTQGGNVMRGDKMVIDLNLGVSRLESGKSRPIEMLIPQSPGGNGSKPGPSLPGAPLRPGQQN